MASSRTWMRFFANVFVMIEDTFEVRYALRHCELIDYDVITTFACHNEPTYVLSRNCSNEYYVANGICCKVDDAMNYLVNVRADFFQGIKFMLHSDDDTYWRPDQVLKWLATIDNSGANRYPLTGNCQFGDDNHKGVWSIANCNEIRTSGWYQPTFFNHAALQRMAAGAAAYGNKDVCNAFIISQDVGIGIFAWMYSCLHVRMPGTNVNSKHEGSKVFTPTDMAVHGVKHKKLICEDQNLNKWPHQDRYNQDMVIGCGDVDHSIVNHHPDKQADMYDAWNYYRQNGQDVTLNKVGTNEYIESFVVVDTDKHVVHVLEERATVEKNVDGSYALPEQVMLVDEIPYKLGAGESIERRVIPRMMPLRGYRDTEHAKKYDITKEWKVFGPEDCNPEGKKKIK